MDVTDKIRPWMKECRLCPRNCGADRMAGQKGQVAHTRLYGGRA